MVINEKQYSVGTKVFIQGGTTASTPIARSTIRNPVGRHRKNIKKKASLHQVCVDNDGAMVWRWLLRLTCVQSHVKRAVANRVPFGEGL